MDNNNESKPPVATNDGVGIKKIAPPAAVAQAVLGKRRSASRVAEEDSPHFDGKSSPASTAPDPDNNKTQYPPTWPASARLRISEFEEQLRNAPAVDMIRVSMVVGFAVLHSNQLQLQERGEFQVSLVLYLRNKGLLMLYNRDIEPHIMMALSTQNQQLHMVQLWQQQQEAAIRQQQLIAAARKKKQTSENKRVKTEHSARKEVYNGPAHNLQGVPELKGWTQKTIRRSGDIGRVDSYWYTPQHGCVFRSRLEIKRFFQYINDPNDECHGDERMAAQKAVARGKRTPRRAGLRMEPPNEPNTVISPAPATKPTNGAEKETPEAVEASENAATKTVPTESNEHAPSLKQVEAHKKEA